MQNFEKDLFGNVVIQDSFHENRREFELIAQQYSKVNSQQDLRFDNLCELFQKMLMAQYPDLFATIDDIDYFEIVCHIELYLEDTYPKDLLLYDNEFVKKFIEKGRVTQR